MTWCSKGLQHPLPPPYLCTTLYSLLLSFGLVLMEKLQEVGLLPLHGTLMVQKVQHCAVFSYRLQDTACQSVQTSVLGFMFWEMSHDAAFLVCSILCFSGVMLLVVFPTAYWDVLMGKAKNSRMRQNETKEWFPSHNPVVDMRWVWSCYPVAEGSTVPLMVLVWMVLGVSCPAGFGVAALWEWEFCGAVVVAGEGRAQKYIWRDTFAGFNMEPLLE